MRITVPEFSLVVLIGASGSGKSTFARRHFKPTEIVSSDVCRGLVADDENDQRATPEAFALVHAIVDLRLKTRRLTVVDATNVRADDRARLLEVARRWHALPVAIVMDPGEEVCRARNQGRPDRTFGAHVVRNQTVALRRGMRSLRGEGFRHIYKLDSQTAVDGAEIVRQRLWTDRCDDHGPFDIIGDVHGCTDELEALLRRLGYGIEPAERGGEASYRVIPPAGRKAVFVGDLVDRGPRIADTLRLVMAMVEDGAGLCVLGNHEAKLDRWLQGREVKLTHGLDRSVAELGAASEEFRNRARKFIAGLVSHYMLDGGRLAVAHAGLKEEMQGRASGAIRTFCMYGETTGEIDEFGLPVRLNWAMQYRGDTKVVFGHTPMPEPGWLNNTLCIDTGCVFGGRLTALRYPELELVSVPAAQVYQEPARPLMAEPATGLNPQQAADELLDLADVSGKRILNTRLIPSVVLREENTAAALEVMSRFAIDPRWLIYLPPTMSPCETAAADGYLEHPREAFDHYRSEGVGTVVCQEKHMGSRALIVACRDADTARRRFGVETGERGAVWTRSGRPFFSEPPIRDAVLERAAAALDRSGVYEELQTDWALLDCEIMPWSLKAEGLIRGQYARSGAAARIGLALAENAVRRAGLRGAPAEAVAETLAAKIAKAAAFAGVVRNYAWPVSGIDDLRIAPFHLLASQRGVHMDRAHHWHLERLGHLAARDPLFKATATLTVTLDNASEIAAAVDWWLELTARGAEGMVVKPADFLVLGEKGMVQPALKCRGRDYLRIVYGPDYDAPEHLQRLRQRSLGTKRSLARREFALGLEGLERFVAGQPLRRVHECVFGVLALESEPIDPRL